MSKIVEIRSTRMGACTVPIPIDPTIKVESRWGKTHGEASISGYGRYLLVDISNSGIHRCRVLKLNPDGSEQILIENDEPSRFCSICEKFRREQE